MPLEKCYTLGSTRLPSLANAGNVPIADDIFRETDPHSSVNRRKDYAKDENQKSCSKAIQRAVIWED